MGNWEKYALMGDLFATKMYIKRERRRRTERPHERKEETHMNF